MAAVRTFSSEFPLDPYVNTPITRFPSYFLCIFAIEVQSDRLVFDFNVGCDHPRFVRRIDLNAYPTDVLVVIPDTYFIGRLMDCVAIVFNERMKLLEVTGGISEFECVRITPSRSVEASIAYPPCGNEYATAHEYRSPVPITRLSSLSNSFSEIETLTTRYL